MFTSHLFAQNSSSPLVVVVNQANVINQLTKRQVIDIYMGRFNTFPDGSPVLPIDHPRGSSQKEAFYQTLVGQNERKVNAYWSRLLFSGRAKPPLQADSEVMVFNTLFVQPYALAYVSEADVTSEMKIVYRFK
ncbi:hypothetical protein [Paraglaciecola sp. L3A3]|uniref:hypothetical protein n=1 Tax=Paraglaciecola sp. L3A3 TaxID=2686358 RepID=UPI00131D5585|nr:hypothetical protein [Paraglaciecola sp. L3A3]